MCSMRVGAPGALHAGRVTFTLQTQSKMYRFLFVFAFLKFFDFSFNRPTHSAHTISCSFQDFFWLALVNIITVSLVLCNPSNELKHSIGFGYLIFDKDQVVTGNLFTKYELWNLLRRRTTCVLLKMCEWCFFLKIIHIPLWMLPSENFKINWLCWVMINSLILINISSANIGWFSANQNLGLRPGEW